MSLSLINSTSSTQTAQGQLVTVCNTIKSSEILTGKTIRFNAAPWVNDSSNPNSNAWQVSYPSSTPTGGIPMTYIGSSVNENHVVNLEVIDASRFKITYCYFNLSNLGAYLNDSNYDNSQVLQPSSVINQDLLLSIEVVEDNDSIVTEIPSNVNPFNNELSIDVTGFNPNSDLCVNFSSTEKIISNEWYVGFVDVTNITSVLPFVDDLSLHYGSVNNGVSIVKDLPITAFNGGTGFIWNGTNSNAQIKVKSSELDVNKAYRLYAVYREKGVWKSYITPELVALSSDREQILGEVTTEVTDAFGNTYNSGCVSNISSCGQVKVCATLDLTSFNSNLAAQGISGAFEDYYIKSSAFVSEGEPTESVLGDPAVFQETLTATDLTLCITLNDDNLIGQRYYTFSIKTTIDGVDDYMNVVIPISFIGSNEEEPVITLDGDLVDRVCVEENSYQLTNVDASCSGVVSVNGGVYSDSNLLTGNTLNATVLSEGDIVCIKLSCEGEVDNNDCVCPPCENNSVTVIVNNIGIQGEPIEIDIQTTLPGQIEVTESISGQTNSGSNVANIFLNDTQGSMQLTFSVVLDNGCQYTGNYSGDTSQQPPITVQLNKTFETQPDCDCDEVDPPELVCDNNAWFTAECDDETGDIVVTPHEDLNSPVDQDEVSTLTGNTELTVTREIAFTDGCPSIFISQTFTCEKIKSCDNSLLIEFSQVDGLVTLNETPNFNSGISSDTGLEYSVDNGSTFQAYTIPVQLMDGETIIWSRFIVFDDGCDDIFESGNFTYEVAEEQPPTNTECDTSYDNFDISIVANDEDSAFTVTKSGDESNLVLSELLWTAVGVDPFDTNGSGVPYMGAVTMRGLFVAAWKIQVEGCPEHIIYKSAYLKPEVKVCELPAIEWSDDNPTLEVCIKECPPCGCTFDIECNGCEATLTNLSGCTDFIFEWYNPNGVLIGTGTGPITLSIEGMHTIQAIGPDCTETIMYDFDMPDAGDPISTPIILQ